MVKMERIYGGTNEVIVSHLLQRSVHCLDDWGLACDGAEVVVEYCSADYVQGNGAEFCFHVQGFKGLRMRRQLAYQRTIAVHKQRHLNYR